MRDRSAYGSLRGRVIRLGLVALVCAIFAVVVPRVAFATGEEATLTIPASSTGLQHFDTYDALGPVTFALHCTNCTTASEITPVVVRVESVGTPGTQLPGTSTRLLNNTAAWATNVGGSGFRYTNQFEAGGQDGFTLALGNVAGSPRTVDYTVYHHPHLNEVAIRTDQNWVRLDPYEDGNVVRLDQADTGNDVDCVTGCSGGGGGGGDVTLTTPDRERLDLIWWGVWFAAGVALVGLIAPSFVNAFKFWRNV